MADQQAQSGRSAFALAMLVFTSGAALMCAELVAGMTIAPYFGSNVFVWGSVICVFMGALSLGYVLGGKAADRGSGAGLLVMLAAAAGLLVAVVPFLCRPVCEGLLGIDLGNVANPVRPLAAFVIVYFLPAMCFGMIVPVAVRIASTTLGAVGRVVGRLYALNALGSVAGALGTMFLLVPFLGNRAVLFGCGLAMIAVALLFAVLQRVAVEPGRAAADAASAAEPGRGEPVAGLRPLVFTCGLVFMGLEVVGGAEIAPYFGSNIFVWGSVITLFLGALSIGYRLGGWLADRLPTMMTLATVVVAAGAMTLLIPLLAPWVCSSLMGATFTGRYALAVRALLASVALYLIPTLLFAMVAPFAVRLSTRDVGRVGGVAGKLYALSTAGNVAGVLLTTFVLISTIGKTHLLEYAGVLAVFVAVAAVFLYNRSKGEPQPVLVSAVLLIVVVALALVPKPSLVPLLSEGETVVGEVETDEFGPWLVVEAPHQDPVGGSIIQGHTLRRVRAERESPYHHIAVIERAAINRRVLGDKLVGQDVIRTVDGQRPVVPFTHQQNRRDLRFDQYVESSLLLDDAAAAIRRPYKAGTTYSDLLHLPFLFAPDIERVLIVGGGGGVVPMLFVTGYPNVRVDVVEIDPVVVDVAEEWFQFTRSGRLRVFIQDGRMFIHNSKDKYDLIILDAYTAGGRIPFHLTTKEFLTDVRKHTGPDGIVLMNVISALTGPSSRLFRSEYKTFKAVFGVERVYVFPKRAASDLPRFSTNVMLIATGPAYPRRLELREVVRRADAMTASKRVKMPSLAGPDGYASNMFTRSQLEQVRQDDVPVLTDDYAPVDMMHVD